MPSHIEGNASVLRNSLKILFFVVTVAGTSIALMLLLYADSTSGTLQYKNQFELSFVKSIPAIVFFGGIGYCLGRFFFPKYIKIFFFFT